MLQGIFRLNLQRTLIKHKFSPQVVATMTDLFDDEKRVVDFCDRIDDQIVQLDTVMDAVLEQHEKDFLQAYRSHIVQVQAELNRLKQKGTELELQQKQEQLISHLESETNKYRQLCSDLQKECAGQGKLVKRLNQQKQIAEHSVKFLEEEVLQQKVDSFNLKRGLANQIGGKKDQAQLITSQRSQIDLMCSKVQRDHSRSPQSNKKLQSYLDESVAQSNNDPADFARRVEEYFRNNLLKKQQLATKLRQTLVRTRQQSIIRSVHNSPFKQKVDQRPLSISLVEALSKAVSQVQGDKPELNSSDKCKILDKFVENDDTLVQLLDFISNKEKKENQPAIATMNEHGNKQHFDTVEKDKVERKRPFLSRPPSITRFVSVQPKSTMNRERKQASKMSGFESPIQQQAPLISVYRTLTIQNQTSSTVTNSFLPQVTQPLSPVFSEQKKPLKHSKHKQPKSFRD